MFNGFINGEYELKGLRNNTETFAAGPASLKRS